MRRIENKMPIADFLAKAVDAPIPQAISNAINSLQKIGALDSEETLTYLGKHLASLPLPPRHGKLLLAGINAILLD